MNRLADVDWDVWQAKDPATLVFVFRGDEILLCRRAIEPRYGYWTLPAGFMENGETTHQGAARETLEEANARVAIDGLFRPVADVLVEAELEGDGSRPVVVDVDKDVHLGFARRREQRDAGDQQDEFLHEEPLRV